MRIGGDARRGVGDVLLERPSVHADAVGEIGTSEHVVGGGHRLADEPRADYSVKRIASTSAAGARTPPGSRPSQVSTSGIGIAREPRARRPAPNSR